MFGSFQRRLRLSTLMFVVGVMLATILAPAPVASAATGDPYVVTSPCNEFGSMGFSTYATEDHGYYSVIAFWMEDGVRTGRHTVLLNSALGPQQGTLWSTWGDTYDPGYDSREAELVMGFEGTGVILDPVYASRLTGCGTPPNRKPLAYAVNSEGSRHQSEVRVTLRGSDPDGDSLSFVLDEPREDASIYGDVMTYVPDGAFVGKVVVRYRARDSHGALSDAANASFEIVDAQLREPEAPVFTNATPDSPDASVTLHYTEYFKWEMTWTGGEPTIMQPGTYPVGGGTSIHVRAIPLKGVYSQGQLEWSWYAYAMPFMRGDVNSVVVEHFNAGVMYVRLNGGPMRAVTPGVASKLGTTSPNVSWTAYLPDSYGLVEIASGTLSTTQVRPSARLKFRCATRRNVLKVHLENVGSTIPVRFVVWVKKDNRQRTLQSGGRQTQSYIKRNLGHLVMVTTLFEIDGVTYTHSVKEWRVRPGCRK